MPLREDRDSFGEKFYLDCVKSDVAHLLRLRLLELNGEWDATCNNGEKNTQDMQHEFHHEKRCLQEKTIS